MSTNACPHCCRFPPWCVCPPKPTETTMEKPTPFTWPCVHGKTGECAQCEAAPATLSLLPELSLKVVGRIEKGRVVPIPTTCIHCGMPPHADIDVDAAIAAAPDPNRGRVVREVWYGAGHPFFAEWDKLHPTVSETMNAIYDAVAADIKAKGRA